MSERDAGKIALEEHFYLPSFEAYGADGSALDGASKARNYDQKYFATVQQRLADVNSWIEDMDRGGIERMVLSLTQPGIQGIPNRKIAVDTAKRMNDELAQMVAANPKLPIGAVLKVPNTADAESLAAGCQSIGVIKNSSPIVSKLNAMAKYRGAFRFSERSA